MKAFLLEYNKETQKHQFAFSTEPQYAALAIEQIVLAKRFVEEGLTIFAPRKRGFYTADELIKIHNLDTKEEGFYEILFAIMSFYVAGIEVVDDDEFIKMNVN